jgi:hypothetical protein
MTIQLMNPQTHEVELAVPGIPTAGLTTSRAISSLIAELRDEYKLRCIVDNDRRRYSTR